MDKSNKTSILIVDDMPQNIVTLEAILRKLNQNLVFATSAKEALRCALQHDFAVILMDVHMPIMNGFETARLIRSRPRSSYTPVIFITALNKEEEDISQGYSMGAVDYIFKPINPVILCSKVQVFVDLFTKSTLAVNLQNELKKREEAEAHRHHAEQRSRKQQQQLEYAVLDRSSSIKEMSSALAHELNQPLSSIKNYVHGCINRLKKEDFKVEDIIEGLKRTSELADHAGNILHRIKNSVCKAKLFYEPVELNSLIVKISTLLQDAIHEAKVNLKLQLSPDIKDVIMLDKIQIEQVIINLIRNAIEALAESNAHERELNIQTKLRDEQNFTIHIKDNGPGIKKEQFPRLFDLYYSTKKNGMGIGLAICRTVIEAHGGSIIPKNNPKGGAWFQITLPIKEGTHVDKLDG